MYPIPSLGELKYPRYTIIFKDTINVLEDKLHSLFDKFDNTTKLFDMIVSKYSFYEITTGDIFELYKLFTDIYNEHYEYYKELLDNYKKSYDYSLGNKRSVIRHDENISNKSGSNSKDYSDISDEYDLPNKNINHGDGNLTGRNKTNGSDTGEFNEHNGNKYDSEIIYQYDNEFLDLKRKYLAQIRNVYEEFANKFNECFIHIYN